MIKGKISSYETSRLGIKAWGLRARLPVFLLKARYQVMVANLTPIGEGLDQILVWQLLRSGSSKVNTAAVAVVVLDGD